MRDPIAAHGSRDSATRCTAWAVEPTVPRSAPGSWSWRKRAHCGSAWGCEMTRVTSSRAMSPRAMRQWWIGSTTSRAIRTSAASPARVSSVAFTEPSREFSIGTTARSTSRLCTAITVSYTVGYGSSSTGPGAEARRASSVNVPAGPRKATRTRSGSVLRGRLLERRVHGLLLLGRELDLGLALGDPLEVDARLVAMHDRGEDHAAAVAVEQGERARLLARELVVGVVADQAVMGDAPVEPLVHAGERGLEAGHRVVDQLAQVREALLDAGRVRHEIALGAVRPEHRPLCLAHPPELEAEDDGEQQRYHRDASGSQGHDAGR